MPALAPLVVISLVAMASLVAFEGSCEGLFDHDVCTEQAVQDDTLAVVCQLCESACPQLFEGGEEEGEAGAEDGGAFACSDAGSFDDMFDEHTDAASGCDMEADLTASVPQG